MDSSIRLKDGRTLAFAEYGEPHGEPVILFHGMPGSRLFHPPDEITRRLGVRLITVDRPGYGRSDFQPQRAICDWPADVFQLADALGLDTFAVAGHSGGGPYVSACAGLLPGRIKAGAILSGAGPIEAAGAWRGMSFTHRAGFKYGRFLPWPVWRLLVWAVYRRRSQDPAADIERGTGRRPAADDALLRLPEIREVCWRSDAEAFRNGLRGLAWDARLLTRRWGFQLEDIHIPVSLWHGSADRDTPVAMGEYVAKKIPSCRKTICPGEGHLLLFAHWEEILVAITSA